MTTNNTVIGGTDGAGTAGGTGGSGAATGGTQGAGAANGTGGAATGGTGGGANDNPFLASLPEEFRNDPSLQMFKDAGGLAKSYLSASKMVGADKIPVPGQHATDEDWSNVFKKLGLPESPDKYELQLPDNVKADDPLLKAFKDTAHKQGILPKQAKELFGWFLESAKTSQQTAQNAQLAKTAEGISGLQKQWGEAYKQEVSVAQAGLKALDPTGELSKMVRESGMGNDPTFIKLMNTYGKTLGEAAISGAGGGSAMTPAQVQSKIDSMMNDPKGPYRDAKHAGHASALKEMEGYFKALTVQRTG